MNRKILVITGSLALLVLLIVLFPVHFSDLKNTESQNDVVFNSSRLEKSDRQFLISHGLKDPVNEIVKDLLSHPELIPSKGTLGGVHSFYSDGISVISRDQVKATFGDGHNDGVMELTYRVSKGNISWKVVKWNIEN
jgi:hypothetical protein